MERQQEPRQDSPASQPAGTAVGAVGPSYNLRIEPVLFDQSGNPRDRILYDAVQEFSKRESGKQASFVGQGMAWAVVRQNAEGDGYEVLGLSRIAFAVDAHIFHVKQGVDQETRNEARRVRDMLVTRMSGYIQDTAGPGTDALVHVEASQERFWQGYLRMIGAKPANRWIVRV